jgi:hypothetical protein
MKTSCPDKCGKKFVTPEHAEAHADKEHPGWRAPKARGWRTPNGFIDFSHPVTYEEACKAMEEMKGYMQR